MVLLDGHFETFHQCCVACLTATTNYGHCTCVCLSMFVSCVVYIMTANIAGQLWIFVNQQNYMSIVYTRMGISSAVCIKFLTSEHVK